MNESKLSVRLIGVLPPSTDLSTVLGELPDIDRRRGMLSPRRHSRPQEVDVWSVILIKRANWTEVQPDTISLHRALGRLRQMAPQLAALDRSGFKAELYVSTIQDHDQGRIELPADVIVLASAARLDLVVSILQIGGSDDDDGDEDADGDDRGPSGRGEQTAARREAPATASPAGGADWPDKPAVPGCGLVG